MGVCASIDHAKFMAEEFNKREINSVFLIGDHSQDIRQKYIKSLENDANELKVIFTVDIFNERVYITSLNTVLMLRSTNSPIVFVHQLGKGPRRVRNWNVCL